MCFLLFSIPLHAARRAMAAACRCPRGQQPIFAPLRLNPVSNDIRVISGLPYLLPPISAKEKSDTRKPEQNRDKQPNRQTDLPPRGPSTLPSLPRWARPSPQPPSRPPLPPPGRPGPRLREAPGQRPPAPRAGGEGAPTLTRVGGLPSRRRRPRPAPHEGPFSWRTW